MISRSIVASLFMWFSCYVSYGRVFQNLNFSGFSEAEVEKLEKHLDKSIKAVQSSESASSHPYSYKALLRVLRSKNISGIGLEGDYLSGWYQFHKSLHEDYDRVILIRQGLTIYRTHQDFQKFVRQLDYRSLLKYRKEIANIKDLYHSWDDDSRVIGGSDHEELVRHRNRHSSFVNYFSEMSSFYGHFKTSKPEFFSLYEDEKYESYRKKTGFLAGVIKSPVYVVDALSTVGLLTGALLDLAVPTKNGSFWIPLTGKIDKFLRNIADLNGYSCNIKGKSRLPDFKNCGKKDVFLVMPPHQLGLPDAFLMAHLRLPGYLLYSYPMAFAPTRGIGQSLANHPQFISVGIKAHGTMSSMEQVEYALENGQGNIILNYAQGHLSPGHIAPLNGKFDQKMVKNLVEKGYRVHIVPLMWHAPSTFPLKPMGLPSDLPLKKLGGQVLQQITPEMVDRIMEREFSSEAGQACPGLLAMIMRSAWIEHKTKFPDLSLREMMNRAAAMKP